jgi:hypothetical protein
MSCGSSRGSSSTTSTMPRVRVPRHIARLIKRLVAPLVVDYFAYVARPGASAHRAARRRLLHLCRASGCFGTSHGLSRDSSSTTSPLACSSSTTSPTPRVRVPRHVAWLVTRLVVDYFTYAARPVASACCEACRVTRRQQLRLAQARRRLLHLCRVSECLGTSRGSSRGSSSKTSTTPRIWVPRHVVRLITRVVAPLVVDYFAYAARPGASARRTARRRLLHLHRASGCFGTSRGLSRDSSSTTSPCASSSSITLPTPCVRVPRHVARLVTRLVIDYFDYAVHPGASARRAARHAARC